MCDDNLANRVSINEADVEHEGNKMVVQDDGLEVEVERYEGPGHEIRYQAVEWFIGGF